MENLKETSKGRMSNTSDTFISCTINNQIEIFVILSHTSFSLANVVPLEMYDCLLLLHLKQQGQLSVSSEIASFD